MLDATICFASGTAMTQLPSILQWLHSVPGQAPWLMALAIIAGTFIHEDITTVVTGMLVADGVVGFGVALPSLYTGIVLGDIGLYGLGRMIALNRISRRIARGHRFSALKVWLDERLVAGVFLVRFLPGLRMPAYTTYGFFAMPLRRFIVSVIFAASIWTTGLFYMSYKFAAVTEHMLGVLRWPVLLVAAIVPLLAIRHLVQRRLPVPTEDAEAGSDEKGGLR